MKAARYGPANPLERWRILVVDDDLPTRLVLEAVLHDDGYDVLTAEDGEEGLRLVRVWRPHLILVDLVMPRSNGFAFAEAYRRLPVARAPLVVMSGVARDAARITAATGAAAVLVKPIDVERLLEVVDVLVRSRAA